MCSEVDTRYYTPQWLRTYDSCKKRQSGHKIVDTLGKSMKQDWQGIENLSDGATVTAAFHKQLLLDDAEV